MSLGISYTANVTGGPATIEGFTSKATCEAEVVKMKDREKVKFAYCIQVTK